jgi:hypothetical protein
LPVFGIFFDEALKRKDVPFIDFLGVGVPS